MSSSLIPSLMAGNNMKNLERSSKLQNGKAANSNSPINNKNQNTNHVSNAYNTIEMKSRQQNSNSEHYIYIDLVILTHMKYVNFLLIF